MVSNLQLTEAQQGLYYLINRLNRLGITIDGQKKIMKLMFLVEHYNPRTKQLNVKGLLGNKFIIYHYGVFSFGVRKDYFRLDELGLVTESPTIGTKNKIVGKYVNLDEKTKYRIDKIIKDFGTKRAWQLEESTLEMLGYNKQTKTDVFGVPVTHLMKATSTT